MYAPRHCHKLHRLCLPIPTAIIEPLAIKIHLGIGSAKSARALRFTPKTAAFQSRRGRRCIRTVQIHGLDLRFCQNAPLGLEAHRHARPCAASSLPRDAGYLRPMSSCKGSALNAPCGRRPLAVRGPSLRPAHQQLRISIGIIAIAHRQRRCLKTCRLFVPLRRSSRGMPRICRMR